MVTTWPLIGRDADLDVLERHLSPTSSTAGVVLDGPAGVGKTTLVREAASRCRTAGATVRWLAGTQTSRSLPFGAVAQHVRLPDGLDAARALRFAADSLLDRDTDRALIVAVDDAHLLDPLSATLVHQLALSGAARLIVSIRSGEPAPDAVTALWKDRHVERRTVGPLTPRQSAAATESYLDGPLDRQSAQRLWSLSEGNPLYLRQLVESWVENGSLRPVTGVWRATGRSTVSGELADVLSTRIGRLGPDVQRVVALLSCCEPLPASVLTSMTVGGALEAAERLGVVGVSRDGGTVRLAHPLFGEVIRSRTPTLAGRRLRGELASALEAGAAATDASERIRRATLAVDGDVDAEAASLVQGSWDAMLLGDLPLGERLARAAVGNGRSPGSDDVEEDFESVLALGYAVSWQGRGQEAEDLLAPLTRGAGDEVDDVRATIPRVANMFWTMHRPAAADEVLDSALGRVSDPVLLDELRGLRAALTFVRGGAAEAAVAATRILAAPGRSDRARTWAAAALSPALAVLGRCADAVELGRRSNQIATSGETSVLRQSIATGEMLGLLTLGDVRGARAATERHTVLAAGELCAGAFAAMFAGWTELAAGHVDKAERALGEAVAAFSLGDPADWTFVARTALVRAQVMTGHVDKARATLALAVEGYRDSAAFFGPELLLARGWEAAGSGRPIEALAHTRRAADLSRGRGQWGLEVHARHTAARFGDRSVGTRLTALTRLVQGTAVRQLAAHATALAAGDPVALLTSARGLRDADLGAAAVDAAAQAIVVARHNGDQVAETAARTFVDDLLSTLGPIVTPALAMVPVSTLTAREREVTVLVARGLSNRDIAARLVVSVRTVEGHIYRACHKLQVEDRAALAALARPRSDIVQAQKVNE